jgi:hypothetical protein
MTKDNPITRTIILSQRDTVRDTLIGELHELVYKCKVAPYLRFIPILTGIEYLGSLYDTFDIDDNEQSEKRFNNALKLFPNSYKPFTQKSNKYYLYKHLRCGMIHQLRHTGNLSLTRRDEPQIHPQKHLKPNEEGKLVIVLEQLYDDLEKACNRFFKDYESDKIPNKPKIEKAHIRVTHNKK